MAITTRASEVKAVAEAIENAQSLEEVAKKATAAAYTALQSRPGPGEKLRDKGLWVVVTKGGFVYGPFGTENEAYKALEAGKIPNFFDDEGIAAVRKDGLVPALGGRAAVLPMRGPLSAAEQAIESDRKTKLFSEHRCSACEHKLAKHGATAGTEACTIPGCKCKAPKPIKL